MNIKRVETARKTVMALTQTVNVASKEAELLEDKLKYLALEKKLREIQSILRINVFLIEDAIELENKAKYCDKCGQLDGQSCN